MFKYHRVLKGLFIFVSLFSLQAAQAEIINGDFSGGATAWETFISPDSSVVPSATSDPSVNFSSGSAVLKTGEGYIDEATICQGAAISCGSTGLSPFLIDSNVLALEFDVSFLNLGADLSESETSPYTDSLIFELWHSTDYFQDINFYIETTGHVSFDVTGFAGAGASLFLRLFDEDDGFDTQVTIDNIKLVSATSVTVPESTSVYLLLLSLLLMGLSRKLNIL